MYTEIMYIAFINKKRIQILKEFEYMCFTEVGGAEDLFCDLFVSVLGLEETSLQNHG